MSNKTLSEMKEALLYLEQQVYGDDPYETYGDVDEDWAARIAWFADKAKVEILRGEIFAMEKKQKKRRKK